MAKRSWDSVIDIVLPYPDANYYLDKKDKDVEMWIPPSKMKLDQKLLDDYCTVARQHQKLNIDEVIFIPSKFWSTITQQKILLGFIFALQK